MPNYVPIISITVSCLSSQDAYILGVARAEKTNSVWSQTPLARHGQTDRSQNALAKRGLVVGPCLAVEPVAPKALVPFLPISSDVVQEGNSNTEGSFARI